MLKRPARSVNRGETDTMSTPTQPGSASPDTRESLSRRERGISAYARIFAVPEQEVPAAFAAPVGLPLAEEALQAAGERPGRVPL